MKVSNIVKFEKAIGTFGDSVSHIRIRVVTQGQCDTGANCGPLESLWLYANIP